MTDNTNAISDTNTTQKTANTQLKAMTELEVNQRFQAFSQQYNILVNMIATLPVHPSFHERICDRLHDGYLRAKECFAMLAMQAQGQAQQAATLPQEPSTNDSPCSA